MSKLTLNADPSLKFNIIYSYISIKFLIFTILSSIFRTFNHLKRLQKFVQELIVELESGTAIRLKLAFIKYVNVILDSATSLNDRRQVRSFLKNQGYEIALGHLIEVQ